ncbi:MAG: hypothetical protein GY880_13060 [Planctomycetaceae bacterium]|nr:hypothetical protein [Planctomycetaceae bacterium]
MVNAKSLSLAKQTTQISSRFFVSPDLGLTRGTNATEKCDREPVEDYTHTPCSLPAFIKSVVANGWIKWAD